MADHSEGPAEAEPVYDDETAWRITAMEMDAFWRAIGHAADSGNRIYNILATSLVLLNGGALTAIVTTVGTTQVTDAIAGAQDLPAVLSLLVKLFSASLIFTLLGLVAGRFADDAAGASVALKREEWPVVVYIKEPENSRREMLSLAAYVATITAVVLLIVALIVTTNSI